MLFPDKYQHPKKYFEVQGSETRKALKKMNNLNDAIIYFEQVIRANEDNHLASSALYEIAKIKIQQKDFYEAYYNLKRANHFKLK